MKNILSLFKYITFNTLRLNFSHLKLKDALKLPILVSKNVKIISNKGSISIEATNLKTGMIKLGYGNIGIFDKQKSKTIIENNGKIVFKGKANIGHGSKISALTSGTIIFGENFNISAESSIVSRKSVVFGKNCLLSWDILVMDTDFHCIYNYKNELINVDDIINIGDNVWIGCRSTILKGVTIPSGCVISSNSMITKYNNTLLKANSIIGGNPVSSIKEDVKWSN